MKRAVIIFSIVFIITSLAPLISIVQSNKEEATTNVSKEIVSMFTS